MRAISPVLVYHVIGEIPLRHMSSKPVSGQCSMDEQSALRFRFFEAEEVDREPGFQAD